MGAVSRNSYVYLWTPKHLIVSPFTQGHPHIIFDTTRFENITRVCTMAFRKPTSFALGFLWASSILHQALCACYNPDGTITKMTDMISCPRSDTFQLDTLCCGLGRENPYGGEKSIGATRDDCLPNGLCENAWVDKGVPKRSWWRGFCTDKNWNNETCLAVCTTGVSCHSALSLLET